MPRDLNERDDKLLRMLGEHFGVTRARHVWRGDHRLHEQHARPTESWLVRAKS